MFPIVGTNEAGQRRGGASRRLGLGSYSTACGIGLRRLSTCLRVCALVTAGIGVAHGSAMRANATEHAGQAAEPTGSIALPEGKAPAEAVGVIGEHRVEPGSRSRRPALPGIDRSARLSAEGPGAGNPVMIRIFKAESELELWMQKDDRFELFATYSICNWSGKLGPKQHEGDRQAPEGMYAVGMPQIHRKGRWPRSLNIGYPNAFDRAMDRTGSYILVHGGCSSIGCYAMTNPMMEEIYRLSEQALKQGQTRIPVHVFPFRMTETNLQGACRQPLAVVLAQPQGRLRRVRAHARAAAGERVRQALRRARGRTRGPSSRLPASAPTRSIVPTASIRGPKSPAWSAPMTTTTTWSRPRSPGRARWCPRRSAGGRPAATPARPTPRRARHAWRCTRRGCARLPGRSVKPGLSPSEPRAAPGPARRRRPACRPPTPWPRCRPDRSS